MATEKSDHFHFCPSCGAPSPVFDGHELSCGACGFRYFQNIAATAGAILEHEGRYLFVVRGREPSKGLLGLPGGFVDPGENLVDAVVREVREEVFGEIENPKFFASFANTYRFGGVLYHTCDSYFVATLITPIERLVGQAEEVDRLCWLLPQEVQPERLGFPSLRRVWDKFAHGLSNVTK